MWTEEERVKVGWAFQPMSSYHSRYVRAFPTPVIEAYMPQGISIPVNSESRVMSALVGHQV